MMTNREAAVRLAGGVVLLCGIGAMCTLFVPSGSAIWILVAPLVVLLLVGIWSLT